jgi:hypothetical protein
MSLAIGTKITVLHRGVPLQAEIYTTDETGGEAFGYKPVPQPLTKPLTIDTNGYAEDPNGIVFPEGEGTEWLRGWGDDAGAVLLATQALRPEPELVMSTQTGRWSSAQPNIQNYPKPRGAGAARDYLLGSRR